MQKVVFVINLTIALLKSSLAQFTDCNDSEEFVLNCPIWAQYGNECTKRPDFMEKHCRKSCEWCPPQGKFTSIVMVVEFHR